MYLSILLFNHFYFHQEFGLRTKGAIMISKITIEAALQVIRDYMPTKMRSKMLSKVSVNRISTYQSAITEVVKELEQKTISIYRRIVNRKKITILRNRLATLQADLVVWLNNTLRLLNFPFFKVA